MSGLMKGIGGVVAAVATAVLIWLLTGPNSPFAPKPIVQTKPIPVEGYVIDAASNNVIAGAQVVVQLASTSKTDQTDSEGRYLFEVSPTEELCHLTVFASGYEPEPYRRTFAITNGSQPLRISLRKAQTLSAPGPTTPPPAHPVKVLPAPMQYIRRSQAVQFTMPKRN